MRPNSLRRLPSLGVGLAAVLLFASPVHAQRLDEVEGAVYRQAGKRTIVELPTGACSNVTSTPIVVGDHVLLPMHERSLDCDATTPLGSRLLGYDLRDGRVYVLSEAGGTEATLTYDAAKDRLYWPILEQGAVRVLRSGNFRDITKRSRIEAVADSAGVVLGGLFYFGTVNTPFPTCQGDPNPDCGALFGVNRRGKRKRQMDLSAGFRGWVTGGVTSDGDYLYAGTGSGRLGGDDDPGLHGCSVVKLDRKLRLVAAADPGDPGCRSSGRGGDDEDAVAGEPALGPESVWVQFTNPNEAGNRVRVVRYDRDLNETCSVQFSTVPARGNASSYYQAPVVDAEGNAYLTITEFVSGKLRGKLYRVDPQCGPIEIASRDGLAVAAPTLVNGDRILFATAERLDVLRTVDGSKVVRFKLGSAARVLAAPIVHEGDIWVLAEDGTLTVLRTGKVSDYGTAFWPRFRRDNAGTATAR